MDPYIETFYRHMGTSGDVTRQRVQIEEILRRLRAPLPGERDCHYGIPGGSHARGHARHAEDMPSFENARKLYENQEE